MTCVEILKSIESNVFNKYDGLLKSKVVPVYFKHLQMKICKIKYY